MLFTWARNLLIHEQCALIDLFCSKRLHHHYLPLFQDAIVNDIWLLIDNQLCPALHSIIVDGLRSHASIWNFIQASTALGMTFDLQHPVPQQSLITTTLINHFR
jgi:hypothetical protein